MFKWTVKHSGQEFGFSRFMFYYIFLSTIDCGGLSWFEHFKEPIIFKVFIKFKYDFYPVNDIGEKMYFFRSMFKDIWYL